MSRYVNIAKVGDIPEGHGKAFEVDGRVIAVFNDHGEYHAIDDCCPHMGGSLAQGAIDDGTVACPWHAWRFDIRDGTWCDNRRIKIERFQLRVQGDDIQVETP